MANNAEHQSAYKQRRQRQGLTRLEIELPRDIAERLTQAATAADQSKKQFAAELITHALRENLKASDQRALDTDHQPPSATRRLTMRDVTMPRTGERHIHEIRETASAELLGHVSRGADGLFRVMRPGVDVVVGEGPTRRKAVAVFLAAAIK